MTRRVLALAAALLGLLVMHGVGVHSAHAADVHAAGLHAAEPHTAGHPAGSMTGSVTASAHVGVPVADPAPRTDHGYAEGDTAQQGCTTVCLADAAAPLPREVSESLLALCLVVLLAVAGLLLLTGPAWRLSLLQPSPRLGPVGPPTSVRARPPDLHALSVLRC